MNSAPSTIPQPIAPPVASPAGVHAMFGAMVHFLAVGVTCFVVPLAMGSNIWPIAGVFWSAFAAPVAALVGAGVGWIAPRRSRTLTRMLLAVSAAAVSAFVAVIIWNNR